MLGSFVVDVPKLLHTLGLPGFGMLETPTYQPSRDVFWIGGKEFSHEILKVSLKIAPDSWITGFEVRDQHLEVFFRAVNGPSDRSCYATCEAQAVYRRESPL